jgi:hypothetical protein
MVSKICRWGGGVCYRVSCDVILPNGLIVVCGFHGNEFGRMTPHKIKPVHVSVFSRHLKAGRRNFG